MNVSDPIADMLTRIRNASRARHDEVVLPASRTQARHRPHPQGRGLHRRLRGVQEGRRKHRCACAQVRRQACPSCQRPQAHQQARPARLRGQDRHPARPGRPGRGHRQHQPRHHDRPAGPQGASWAAKSSPTSGRSPCHVSADSPSPSRPASTSRIDGNHVTVKGPKGELSRDLAPELTVVREDGSLRVERPNDDKRSRELHGLTRTLVANMVTGVTTGYRKGLEITGVGYRAQLVGTEAPAQPGLQPPDRDRPARRASASRSRTPPGSRSRHRQGAGRPRAPPSVRAMRKPEPYKGKGVRYAGEVIRRKAGKAGKIGGKK